jgi:hypothetical protein
MCMMRQLVGILTLAGALGSAALAQSGLELVQPDAGVVLGVEWRQIVDSALGGRLTDQLKKTQMSSMPGMQALQAAVMHDLDSMVIAIPVSALAHAKANTKPPVLFVVKGRFHVDLLRGLMMQKNPHTETYRSVELIAAPDDARAGAAPDQNQLAFLDANTILGGDRGQVRAAIDRVKTGHLTPVGAGLLSGAAALASKNDVWMIFDLPPGALKDAPPAAAQMFAAVRGAELGLSFQHGFGLLLNIRTQDADSATTMAQALQGLVAMSAMGAMGQGQSPQVGELVKKIRIAPENSRVSLSLSLDRNEVQSMIAAATASATRVPAADPAKHDATPPSRRPIRITGLDGGPVDVQPAAPKN